MTTSKTQLFDIFRKHHARNYGLAVMVMRVVAYTLLACIIVSFLGVEIHVAEGMKILGIGMMGFLVEAIFDGHVNGKRKLAYLSCIAVMCLSGMMMTRQVALLHASASERPAATAPHAKQLPQEVKP